MGGKAKQSQRTKNNVRPSSSGRSAELLTNSGATLAPFSMVTSSPTKAAPVLFPALAALNSDQNLNTDFMLCIKKVNKKDPITKLKALQELTELVNSSTVEDVVALLPFWTRIYRNLTTDFDHKVREATQICHSAICARVGRELGPQLRHVLPSWLQAQYDSYPPAATAAQKSLTSTFPEHKLPDVISFCKSEVVTHLLENLIGNTEAILQKKVESSAGDVDMTYSLITVGSLQGLQYFTQHLAEKHQDWLLTELTPLLESTKFWKLANHNSGQIKAAWFSALGVLIERYKYELVSKWGARLVPLLLAASKERNSLVAAPVWTCLLLLMYNVENWDKWMTDKRVLTKRIIDILENGGWGDAKHLTTMTLPLLAHLPPDLLTQQFYEDFFAALLTGLQKKSVISSKSERQLWITSLYDCLRYLSIQEVHFVIEVITSVHRAGLEKILSVTYDDQLRTNLIKHSTASMVALFKYWLQMSKKTNGEKYDQLVRNFWQNIISTLLNEIDKLPTNYEEIKRIIDGHILLLQTLKCSFSKEAKRKQSIKFEGDTNDINEEKVEDTGLCDISAIEIFTHNLNGTVYKVCSNYFEVAEKKQVCDAVISPLLTLIIEFDNKNLFEAMASHFGGNMGKELSIFGWYHNVLKVWLSGDTMRCKSVVDVVFRMLKHLPEAEQDQVLDSFRQFPPSVVEMCISLCVCHPHCTEPSVRRFMRGSLVDGTLIALCRRLLEEGDCTARNLLMMCLSHDAEGRIIISVSTVSKLVSHFASALDSITGESADRYASIAAQVLGALAAGEERLDLAPLIQSLFRLGLMKTEDFPLSLHTRNECTSSWQDALTILSVDSRQNFLSNAVGLVTDRLKHCKRKLNIPDIEHMSSICPKLIHKVDELTAAENIDEITSFTSLLFDQINSLKETETSLPAEYYALRHDCLKFNLQCLFEDDNDIVKRVIEDSSKDTSDELTELGFTSYVNIVLFRALYLKALIKRHKDEDDNDQAEESNNNWCDSLLGNEYLAQEFLKLMYDYSIIQSLHEGYAFWKHYELIVASKSRIDFVLDDIIAFTSADTKAQLLTKLNNFAATQGYYWSYAARHYAVKCDVNEKQELANISDLQQIMTGNGFFHTLQANTKSSSDLTEVLNAKFLLMLRGFYLAHAEEKEVVNEKFPGLLAESVPTCDMEVLIHTYHRHNHVMLYDRNICTASWQQVISNAAIVEFLTTSVLARGWEGSQAVWDFTTITLCSLLNSVNLSRDNWGCSKVALITRSVLSLYVAVLEFISKVPEESIKRQPSNHVAHLPTEWKDIFAPDIDKHLLELSLYVLEHHTTAVKLPHAISLSALSVSLPPSPPSQLPPGGVSKIVHASTDTLVAITHHGYKYLAHCVLQAMEKNLVLDDVDKLTLWSSQCEQSEENVPKPPFSLSLYFSAPLTELQELVDAVFSSVDMTEESCEVVPFTDSYSVCLGYFLIIDALYRVCSLAKGDLMHQYIEHFREHKYAGGILTACLSLIPAELRHQGKTTALDKYKKDFNDPPTLSLQEPPQSSLLSSLACRALARCVSSVSACSARGWHGAARPRLASLLARIVQTYVAPTIVRAHLDRVHKAREENDDEDTEITIHWSSYEVQVIHRVDDRPIQLTIDLARDHPLSLPEVETSGGPYHNTQWIAVYLSYQNGDVSNAIRMWIDAVHRRVEAAPICYICYCRLHPASGLLPRTQCHQCKNKYHTACLQKWFASSSKSKCPLCRATF